MITTLAANAVAWELYQIFLIQGCPLILQHDNGREFVNDVILRLKKLWPECVIVRGRPRHPQSQGSVERANQDVEKMLGHWMTHNRTKAWSVGIHKVCFDKNKRNNGTTGFSPYELIYGQTPRVNIESFSKDVKLLRALTSEAQLETILSSKAKDTLLPIGVDEPMSSQKGTQSTLDTDEVEIIPGLRDDVIINPPSFQTHTSNITKG